MVDVKKKSKKAEEKTEAVDEATQTSENQNPTDIGPGITERYKDA